ncbi:MAG: DUF4118 domain-containing protein [Acidimicrobiales bacterium]
MTRTGQYLNALRAVLRERRVTLVAGLALVVPYVLAVVLVPFRGTFANPAAALSFVAVIASIAMLGNRLSGLLATLSSLIWFDFYLTKPYDLLTISHRPDLETALCIVVVGLVVNELAAANRRSFRRATEGSAYVRTLHEMAVLVGGDVALDEVIDQARRYLTEILMLRDCVFEPVPVGLPYARITADGTVVHVGLQWPTKELGIPGPHAEIVAQWRGESFGRFVLTPTPGQPVSLDRRVVAVAVASLVAGARASERRRLTSAGTSDDT